MNTSHFSRTRQSDDYAVRTPELASLAPGLVQPDSDFSVRSVRERKEYDEAPLHTVHAIWSDTRTESAISSPGA